MKQALRGEDLEGRRPAGLPFYFKDILFVLYRENYLSVEIQNAPVFLGGGLMLIQFLACFIHFMI